MNETALTLEESIQVLTIGLILMFLTSFAAWRNGYFQLPQGEDPQTKLPLKNVIIPFIIFLCSSILFVPFIYVFALYFSKGTLDLSATDLILINTLSIFVTFLALVIYFRCLSREKRNLILGRSFGINSLKDITMGVLSWFISFPFVIVAGKIIGIILHYLGLDVVLNQVAVHQVKSALSTKTHFFGLALGIVIFVPIIEEFLFRGCLQTWIKEKVGIKKAILLTSVVFACFHFSFSQGLGNIELLVSLFILSCFLGFVYERQQSLLASISLHAFFNAVTVGMIALS